MSHRNMGLSRSTTILLLIAFFICVILPAQGVHAFGAGNIPSFAYLEGKAFRHGDIEDTLADLAKKGGGAFGLGALIGSKGPKFGGLDVKRVYFGNWLRDYSQAVDIAGLKKLQLQTIINLCMALGFLAHGYATHEFEVTEERLGVYLPTEHIDNPKGYGEGEDARQYNPKLRGPVDPRELEIDPHTGMKNYIANENGNWDTSKALVRRTLERCIQYGRQARQGGRKEDLYESYRLLGQLLHTLEDFPAHSNFCELALVSMGHGNVFVHVGDQVKVQAPNRKWVAPLVTGTFGSSDFIHSLLGEATDHISQASVTDLNKEFDHARERSRSGPGSTSSNIDTLRDLLFQIPGGGGGEMAREMDSIERIRAGPAAGGKRPEDMSPQELHAVLWQVLTFRDSVVKKIEKTIEKIPGLGPLIEKIMDSISVFIFTTLEPYLKPLLKTATTGLQAASGEVIDSHDQYEVFNDPRASDPTHSFLSKDHFNLILNEPAGNVAKVIVTYTVQLVVKAWDDTSVNVRQMSADILECLFHPEFHNPSSTVQRQMLQYMRDWVQSLGHNRDKILSRLSKESVREHKNIRLAGEGGQASAVGTAAYNAGVDARHDLQGYLQGIPGVSQAQGLLGQFSGGGAGIRRDGEPGGMPGSGGGYVPPPGSGGYAPPPPSSGEAASFYGAGAGTGGSGGVSSPPPPPPMGSRPQVGGYDSGSSVPSFPGAPSSIGGGGPPPPSTSTYPGASSYDTSAPSFPSASGPSPSFGGGAGGHEGHHGGHGHGHGHHHGHGQPQPHHQNSGYSPSYGPPSGGPPSSNSSSSYAPPPGGGSSYGPPSGPPPPSLPHGGSSFGGSSYGPPGGGSSYGSGGGSSYGGMPGASSYAPPSSGYGASGFPEADYGFSGGGMPGSGGGPSMPEGGPGFPGASHYEPPRGPPPPPPSSGGPPGESSGGYYGGGGW